MSDSPIPPHRSENGRRTFLRSALTGAATLASSPWLGAASPSASDHPKTGVFAEPAQDLPLGEDVDVIVCGAGPAGIAAALAAARAGAKTRLIEIHGCLGGVWTAGLLTYIFDFNKPGITKEIIRRLDERDARRSKLPDNLVMVMINHEYGIKAFDAPAITEATIRARAEVFNVVRGLRKLGGPWEGMQIVATPEQIGVRDGRRIHGRYTVNRDDLATGVRHEDAVTRATFGVDIHAHVKESNDKKAIIHADFKFHPYDIPLRALIAKDVDGLLMAGRCISGDFTAHASYRVTGNSVAMGEAAGATAAVAARSKRPPHEVAWSEVKAVLEGLHKEV